MVTLKNIQPGKIYKTTNELFFLCLKVKKISRQIEIAWMFLNKDKNYRSWTRRYNPYQSLVLREVEL